MLAFDPARYDAAIFDCDGTLADTMPLHHEAWKIALRRYRAPFEFSWELFTRRAGMTLERTVEELNIEYGCCLPPRLVAEAQRHEYGARAEEIGPIEFVVEFAREVARTHPIAVASGSKRPAVTDALRRIGMLDALSAIVTAEDVVHGKPSPDGFLLAAQRLEVQPQRCLVVEDGRLGLLAAQRAQMDAYLIERSGTATLFVSSTADLVTEAATDQDRQVGGAG